MRSKIIFPKVRATLGERNWNLKDLSANTGIPLTTLYDKMTGRTELTFGQAYDIKNALGSNLTLEELFSVELFETEEV